ncbi:MAG TPA: PEGA domain-containing protein [Polyangiaceae bacterium]|nr:PEGA domain-containing protein [Polyangiaceae bacterium]
MTVRSIRVMAAALLAGVAVHASLGIARADDAQAGWLDVASDPSAEILVDEVDTDKATPQTHMPLKAGHHKLTLVTKDGAHKRSIGFNVTAGQTTKLTIHLSS